MVAAVPVLVALPWLHATVTRPVHTAKSTMDLALDEIKPGLTRKSDYTSTEQIDLFNRAGGFDAVKREAKKRKLL